MNCKTCNRPFEPIRGLNGLVKSKNCPDCQYVIQIEKRKMSMRRIVEVKPKDDKKALKSKLTKVKKASNPKKSLTRKLDEIFSIFIRLRDSDSRGVGRCISCSTHVFWKKEDNGHYIGRQHKTVRWDEINCNLQCRHCNRFEEGLKAEYRVGLIQKYDLKTVELLELKQSNTSKISQFEMECLIKIYQEKVKKLESEKLLEGNQF